MADNAKNNTVQTGTTSTASAAKANNTGTARYSALKLLEKLLTIERQRHKTFASMRKNHRDEHKGVSHYVYMVRQMLFNITTANHIQVVNIRTSRLKSQNAKLQLPADTTQLDAADTRESLIADSMQDFQITHAEAMHDAQHV